MYRSFLSAGLLAFALLGNAQSYVHQVLVLNEGYFDYFGEGGQLVPVTLGSYDPLNGTYTTVVTIAGPRFGSDVLVDEGSIYVAADDRVLRYDADSYALLEETEIAGVRKIAVWNDQLLLTRGELGGLDHYFEARNKQDLSFLYSITPTDGLSFAAEDVLVVGNKAYLAVGNAFDFANLQGRVGVVDLLTQTYGNEVDLGIEGRNPERLMERDGAIYAFSNKDFTGSSVSKMVGGTLAYVNNVAENSGCAASTMVGDNIYFMEYDQSKLARFNTLTGQVLDTLVGSPSVYGLIEDPINNVLYASTTDFFSSGELHVLNLAGQIQSTVPVGVSPGNMALDIRSSTGISTTDAPSFGVYPNPAIDLLSLTGSLPSGNVQVCIADALGREVITEQRTLAGPATTLDVSALTPGVYTVSLNGGSALRFSKQ